MNLVSNSAFADRLNSLLNGSVVDMMAFEVNIWGWLVMAAIFAGIVYAIVRFEKSKKEQEKEDE